MILAALVVGQLLLIAAMFTKAAVVRRSNAPLSGALLVLSVVGYLVVSDDGLRSAAGAFEPAFLALALLSPYLLWAFAISVFDMADAYRPFRLALFLVPAAAWGASVSGLDWAAIGMTLHRAVAITILVYVVWTIYRERGNDLMEKRRRYRFALSGVVVIQALAVLIAELWFADAAVPETLELLNKATIALMVFALSIPLLSLNGKILWFDQEAPAPSPSKKSLPVEDPEAAALLNLMDQGYYQTLGLTIGQLAAELKTPEHRLRKLINQRLGYRNFSAFVNSYRLSAAKERLSDPELATRPVLSIAMDLGFTSIGPFNRAFKLETGQTPSEYRRNALSNPADEAAKVE